MHRLSAAVRSRWVWLLILLLVGAPVVAQSSPTYAQQAIPFQGDRMVTVMTRNLYLGADLIPLIGASTPQEFAGAAALVYTQAAATDIPGRMDAVAAEIAANEPLLVGLQEVSTWSTGPFMDPQPATHVQFDYLQLLLTDLARRGFTYEPVVIADGFDAEAPSALGVDVRLTVRDVLLARSGLKTADLKLSNPQSGRYNAMLSIPNPVIGDVNFYRQWASIDAKVRGKSFRFITTHLEAYSQLARYAQAQELLAGPAVTDLPTIVLSDFNSQTTTPNDAAAAMVAGGFTDVWSVVNPADSGLTCCQAGDLRNPVTQVTERIDLVFTRGGFTAVKAVRVGADALALPSGVQWASDHAGLVATVELPR